MIFASGLYYIAEFIEEHTVVSKRIITWMMRLIALIHLCLMIELDVYRILFSLFCLGVYSLLLDSFPIVVITSPAFVISCSSHIDLVAVFVNHWFWFQYFTTQRFPLGFVASWFGLCVWLVPFTLFISTCANESTLPYGKIC